MTRQGLRRVTVFFESVATESINTQFATHNAFSAYCFFGLLARQYSLSSLTKEYYNLSDKENKSLVSSGMNSNMRRCCKDYLAHIFPNIVHDYLKNGY